MAVFKRGARTYNNISASEFGIGSQRVGLGGTSGPIKKKSCEIFFVSVWALLYIFEFM